MILEVNLIKVPYFLWSDDKAWLDSIQDILAHEHIAYEVEEQAPITINDYWWHRMLNLAIVKKPKEFFTFRDQQREEFNLYTPEERTEFAYIIRTPRLLKYIESARGKTIYRLTFYSRDARMVKIIEQEALDKDREFKSFTSVWAPQSYHDYEVPAMRYSLHTTPLKELKR